MKYSYFPGCSLEKSALSYEQSTRIVAQELGVEFVEVEDWNCCSATECISLNLGVAYAVIARDLALAEKQGLHDLVCPCSACYLNLSKADRYLQETPKLAERTNQALAEGGLSYKPGSIRVRHLVDIFVNDVGLPAIAAKVIRPLSGLKIASYYGCLLGRPGFHGQIDDPENPILLDEMVRATGGEPVNFPLKAHCCGGHMTQLNEATGYAMILRLLKNAVDNGADVISTPCPMCQMNLDAFQGPVNRYFKTNYHIPILYFTQLIGLAFGMNPKALGIGSELVDARGALSKIGTAPPATEDTQKKAPPPRRRDDKSLPMPQPLPKKIPVRRAA